MGLSLGLPGVWGRMVGLEEEVEREGDGVDGEHDDEDARDEAAEPLAVVLVVIAPGHHRRPPECAPRRRGSVDPGPVWTRRR